MKILISWSGERSKKIALDLSKFLKRVIQATDPWVSDRDIAVGTFWHEELWKQLEIAKAGVICLTPEMLKSEWVHFEAGALAKAMNKLCVCPYLFDLTPSDIQGPLSFLQVSVANMSGTEKLVRSINDALEAKRLSEDDLKDAFLAHWPAFKQVLEATKAKSPPTEKPKKRETSDLLEEILVGIRDLQKNLAYLRLPARTWEEAIRSGSGKPVSRLISFEEAIGSMSDGERNAILEAFWRFDRGDRPTGDVGPKEHPSSKRQRKPRPSE